MTSYRFLIPSFDGIPAGKTRVGSISAVPRVLEELGTPLAPLLDAVGLPRSLFESDENIVGIAEAMQLLNLAAETTACPHFGLLCGAHYRPRTIGIAGQLTQNARDVGSALRGLTLNLHLNGHAFVPTLMVTGETAEFGLHLATASSPPARVAVDLGLAGAFSIIQAVCGPDWRPLDVLLVHRPGGSSAPYDRFYRVPVHFGSHRNGIVFPARWLRRPVHDADAGKRALLERELAVMAQRNPLPPAMATRRALLACIARGDVSVREVAATLGLGARTLNRRLADEGTSVVALARDVRYQVARELLANTRLSVGEVAATLVYGNIGAFTRAFRQWSGVTPSHWRRLNGARHRRSVTHDGERARRPNAPTAETPGSE